MVKITAPRYYPVKNSDNQTYRVESETGIVADDIGQLEAAKALAVLCCLGYMYSNNDGELAFSVDIDPEYDGPDEFEYTSTTNDDGPSYEEEELPPASAPTADTI